MEINSNGIESNELDHESPNNKVGKEKKIKICREDKDNGKNDK